MKKIVTIIILCLGCIGILGAQNNMFYDEASDLYYEITDYNTVKVTYFDIEYHYYSGDVEIPSSVEYQGQIYTVTAIDDNAFAGCANLTSVHIPNTVTTIGEKAFGFSGLVSIVLPNSVASIGEKTFYYCQSLESVTLSDAIASIPADVFVGCVSLAEVALPTYLESIGQQAFAGCSALSSLDFPDGLHTIGSCAFQNSGLVSVVIPNSVTTIEGAAFYQCESLLDVQLSESMTVIESSLFYNCSSLRFVSIPSQLVTIRKHAFHQCFSLEEVTIPATVTTIETGAFNYCESLVSVSIPSNVTQLGAGAFSDCYALTSVSLPIGLDTIANYLFNSCQSLSSISIPESVVYIGELAFSRCDSLSAVFIPRNVDTIGKGAFSYCCSLEAIEIDPDNTRFKSIDGVLFNSSQTILMQYPAGRRNSTYLIPSSVTKLGGYSFSDASHLIDITIPSSVSMIEDCAFIKCNGLRTITIPAGTIGWDAFYGCENLSTVYIGFSVDQIGSAAFKDCQNLSLVILGNPNASIGSEAFLCVGYAGANTTVVCLGDLPGNAIQATSFPYTENQEMMIVPCGQRDVYYNAWNYTWHSGNFEDDCNYYNVNVMGNEGDNQVMVSTNTAQIGGEITCFVALEPDYMLNSLMAYKADDESLKVPLVDNKFVMPNFDVTIKAEFEHISVANGRPEWYYEIMDENGTITYQHLQQEGDTVVNNTSVVIIIRTNTLYDKGKRSERVTHEYIYEEDNVVYWWNKDLEEFTVLYDLGAEQGDSWVIKVGTETLTMTVDAVEQYYYEGRLYRMLQVSDDQGFFSGTIVCGIGHLTSFFPERLMNRGKNYRVEGIRCYWREGELVFKYGDRDCDEVYQEYHNGIEEDGPSTGSGALTVFPNPTNGILVVETRRATSLPTQTYRITNLTGQTVLTGSLAAETQQIDVSALPEGMYFITVDDMTRKFVVH